VCVSLSLSLSLSVCVCVCVFMYILDDFLLGSFSNFVSTRKSESLSVRET